MTDKYVQRTIIEAEMELEILPLTDLVIEDEKMAMSSATINEKIIFLQWLLEKNQSSKFTVYCQFKN